MYFTGINFIPLPQVNVFNFMISGINISNVTSGVFSFIDVSGSNFNFHFQNNLIYEGSKIISSYNTIDSNLIVGYISGNVLAYSINGINNQKNLTFSRLSGINVNPGIGNSAMSCDIIINSETINYNVSFAPSYNVGGILTGTISSDTSFQIFAPHLLFFGSNKQLLNNTYGIMNVNSGTNNYQFEDIDTDIFEYEDNFFISLPVSFGDIGGKFSSYRSGINDQTIMSLADFVSNVYYDATLFSCVQEGNEISYDDIPSEYTLGYSYTNMDSFSNELEANLLITFYPINPQNNNSYQADYITGYQIISGGLYNDIPSVSFSQYYYVTGIQNSMQSFLFSSGCTSPILVTFSGGNSTSGASGTLILKPVRLSGIYSTGIANFNIVSGYSGISNGWSYQSPPVFILHTGGSCYSLPDISGYQTAQFMFATGYGSVYGQAYGLTGIPLCTPSSYILTGIEVTNIGVGYGTGFPPVVTFTRQAGDFSIEQLFDASGNPVFDSQGGPITFPSTGAPLNAAAQFYYKQSGIYEFLNFWNISYNIGDGYIDLPTYNGGYSGNIGIFGNGNINLNINLSGLDNTSPISGILSLTLTCNGYSATVTNTISQSRLFDMSTGAMATNIFPVINFIPLQDLLFMFGQDQSYEEYLNSLGGGQSSVINF